MDPRVDRHAELIVDRCTDVSEGDNVVLLSGPEAEDLNVALFEKIGERGGMPIRATQGGREHRSFIRAIDTEALTEPNHLDSLLEATDVLIMVRASRNVAETSDVAPESMQAFAQIMEPIQDHLEGENTDTVITQHPAPGDAQKAEMSTDGYTDFVYDAIDQDWDAQEEHQRQLVEILDPAAEVRVVAGEETDVTMSIEGNPAVNSVADENLPSGEVFTAPIPDSVEGTVRFDMPVVRHGREVEGAYLEFEDGEVIAHEAEQNEAVLTGILNTDGGARRLGELGIGMNRDIDRFTHNMLFDEKMGDTVHMAIGKSIEESVGEDNPKNESVVHLDMIVDMSEDSFIEVDGERIQEDGTFVFEDGFEG
ncbi:Aminopeptidase protein [Halorhabdus tiamatea SARL4B]|uniref:Aminopeptidase protein n=1 Tax=Halorhabdus tiamatea SARL4B TaxID=1033806 RepID=F7PF94_9EURY|nr:aminopeptidase [Halorhabdus tiamatea]ERJ05724.1 Aminopeptidase protein [Halorhabdus tiamatea SARL4B]CCQ33953.1 peptidase M29 aminopeptidase II [Halorhabdus tiamatea SARL4B]